MPHAMLARGATCRAAGAALVAGGSVFGRRARQALAQAASPTPAAQAGRKRRAVSASPTEDLQRQLDPPCLGIVRLDYNYPPSAGDVDFPASFGYRVIYRAVPGLTFDMAKSGAMTGGVWEEFKSAIAWLEEKGVCGITGDCGFMMAYQSLARQVAEVPVFLSSLVQCPMISAVYDTWDRILILTADSKSLEPQKELLLAQCGFSLDDERFIVRGCEDVDGFEAVKNGEKVDEDRVTPGVRRVVDKALHDFPTIRAIVLECTELPMFGDALRREYRMPVFDAITCADFFIASLSDNPRCGADSWQKKWDGRIEDYKLGDNLPPESRAKLING